MFSNAPVWTNGEGQSPLAISPINSSSITQDIILDKETEDLFRRLIRRLVLSYHAYAGVTMGPPRVLRFNTDSDTINSINVNRYDRVTPRTVKLFKALFTTNTHIPNIATIDLRNIHFLDYAMLIQEYLPANGVIVYSNDRKFYNKIYDPYFFMNCNLSKDNMGYRFTYDTSIKVMNGYNKSHKEVSFKIGRIIDLRIYILIDPKAKRAKIYRIDNITKPPVVPTGKKIIKIKSIKTNKNQ